jgi:hypothetical protein
MFQARTGGCPDHATNAIVAVEGTVLEGGVLTRCRADGVLVAIQP